MMNKPDPNIDAADDDMQDIMQGILPRPEPSAAARDKAYLVLKQDWQEQVKERRSFRRTRRFLSAAAGIGAIGVAIMLTNISLAPNMKAELVAGEVNVDALQYTAPYRLSVDLESNITASKAARFELQNGAELRLAARTQIEWLDAGEIYLKRGAAYVDTHNQANILIKTDYGDVRDIGTRFMVTVAAEGANVAVREGIAQVKVDSAVYDAVAEGQTAALISIDPSGVTSSTELASDSRWEWIHDVGAGYQASVVPDLLSLIGRDLGKRVIYANRGVEATVASIEVQGDLAHISPRKALALVAQSAGLRWREENSQIIIDFNH